MLENHFFALFVSSVVNVLMDLSRLSRWVAYKPKSTQNHTKLLFF